METLGLLKLKNNFISILGLMRIHNILIALFVAFCALFLLNIDLSKNSIICIGIILLFMSSGYIMNDLMDISIDNYNQKKKTFLNDKKNIKIAYCINLCLLAIGLYLSIFINEQAKLFLYSIIIPLLFLYNFLFKKYAIIGNITVSFLLASVFIFLELALINTFMYLFYPAFFAFLINFIREIIKDIEDYKGDKKFGFKTLPIILGVKQTTKIIIVLIILFCLITILHAYFNYFLPYLISLIILVEIPLFYSLFLLFNYPNKNTFNWLSTFYKIIIINGLFVIISMKEII